MRALLLSSLLLVTAGCGEATPTLTIDGTRAENLHAGGSIIETTDRTIVDLALRDPGPPGVADADISYQFRLELAPGVTAGAALDVDGIATLDGGDLASSFAFERTFAAAPAHDARVLGVSMTTACFCGSGVTHFEEPVFGHVDVVELSAGRMVLEVELRVTGVVPGSFEAHTYRVSGRFTASLSTR